ncbi:hypothetical protein LCGC14_1533050 [marine sediment metagenome]|uniref:Uncharacterized protein n=1 Tax=marine sediment metagenome TaxID=412755 RepID=A0A0F9IVH2_9ZZZZ
MGIDGIPGPQVFRQRDVRRTATASVTVAQQLSPIGSIVAWAKTLAGVPALPAGWVQCDGQVLSDADSLLDGTTIPDLNGNNQFMRGNSTSGATGGSETMAHTHTIPGLLFEDDLQVDNSSLVTTASGDDADVVITSSGVGVGTDIARLTTSGASNAENRPPFYNVVWIMRIK